MLWWLLRWLLRCLLRRVDNKNTCKSKMLLTLLHWSNKSFHGSPYRMKRQKFGKRQLFISVRNTEPCSKNSGTGKHPHSATGLMRDIPTWSRSPLKGITHTMQQLSRGKHPHCAASLWREAPTLCSIPLEGSTHTQQQPSRGKHPHSAAVH